MKLKRLIFVVALGLGLAVPTSVRAAPFFFDPDGPGPSGTVLVNTFDYQPGSALAVGANTSILSFLVGGPVVPFDTLFQAKLGSLLNPGGGAIVGTGLNASFEITIVARFTETVAFAGSIGTTGSTAVFVVAPGAVVPNFFEIYFHPSLEASDQFGTGFNDTTAGLFLAPPPPTLNPADPGFRTTSGDAILIAAGSISSGGISNFTIADDGGLTPNLDGFGGTDNYPAIDSRVGTGGTNISGPVTFLNPLWFPGALPGGAMTLFNTSQVIPFDQADPSSRFVFLPGGSGVGPPTIAGAGIGVASLGTVNGFLTGTNPDVQFQADANETFNIQQEMIPEPGTIVLSVIGFGGLAAARFVRRRRQAAA